MYIYYYINYHGNDYGKLHVNEIYKSYYNKFPKTTMLDCLANPCLNKR